MQELERPYLQGSSTSQPLPLGRFLPPYASGTATAWLSEQTSGGQWLLDPTGSNPALALEAARAGYRVLITSNNPVLTFMLEVLASAPRSLDFKAAIAELGALRRGSERLELQIQALYETQCPGCSAVIPAGAFIWRRGETQPFSRLVRCPQCGTEGDFAVTAGDLERMGRTGPDALHRSRALERVAPAGDEDRPVVEDALKSYLPRPLYVLFTLMNKVEGLPSAPERKRLLTALLLSLCDAASSLWAYPLVRSRPRQLTIPPTFRENNLWLALEEAIPEWCVLDAPVPVTRYPQEPPATGGICIFPGRLKSLLSLPESIRPAAAVGVLPRPNQAFWTLSALWAGWLWGREAVQPLKSSFDRRRYDWHWHAGALHSLFSVLNSQFPAGFPLFALLPELAPGFMAAAVAASRAAGLRIEGFALRDGNEAAQLTLRTGQGFSGGLMTRIEKCCQDGIEEHLSRRGEPDDYLRLYCAAVLQTATGCSLPVMQTQVRPETLDQIHGAVTRLLTERSFLIRYGEATASAESGLWWLVDTEDVSAPLADRVELAVAQIVGEEHRVTYASLETRLLGRFPGLVTPDPELVRACLKACATPLPGAAEVWEKQAGGNPDAGLVESWLIKLARTLGFIPTDRRPQTWNTSANRPQYFIAVTENAVISPALLSEQPAPGVKCVLVYPESHAALATFKIQRDPRLIAAKSWRFLTIERLRQFLSSSEVSLAKWEALLNDQLPGEKSAEQMAMF